MKVAVLGAGGGGMAVAYEWASRGHEVSMFSHAGHDHELGPVRDRGGVIAEGVLEGFAPIVSAGTDIGTAMDGAEGVLVVGPAYSTEVIARDAAAHLRPGMTVVVCPGSCVGSVAFKRAAGLDLDDESVVVGETSTLPYAARSSGGVVRIFHRFDHGVYAAAAPRAGTQRVLDMLQQVYPNTQAASTVLQTTLQNGNPVIHPAVTLLNAALIDRTRGDFMFYEDGVTEATGNVMEAVDRERLAIGAALGLTVIAEPEIGVIEGYMREATYTTGYSTAPGFLGIKAQDQLDHRYLTEDVGYSLVFWTDLARALEVDTPTMDALIVIASVVLGRDFRGEGARTLKSTGLAELTREQLLAY